MLTTLYKIIEKIVLTRLPEIKYFSLYRDQFNAETDERPFRYPAILLEFPAQTWEQLGEGVQHCEMPFTLHLGVQFQNNIESYDKKLDENLSSLDIVDKIYTAFRIPAFDIQFSGITEDHIEVGNFIRINQEINTPIPKVGIYYSKIYFTVNVNQAHLGGFDYLDIEDIIITNSEF